MNLHPTAEQNGRADQEAGKRLVVRAPDLKTDERRFEDVARAITGFADINELLRADCARLREDRARLQAERDRLAAQLAAMPRRRWKFPKYDPGMWTWAFLIAMGGYFIVYMIVSAFVTALGHAR